MKILYISPMNVLVNNGMLERQKQLLFALCKTGEVELITLHSKGSVVEAWLRSVDLPVKIVSTRLAYLARLNSLSWLYINYFLCNKLKLYTNFRFFFKFSIGRDFFEVYDRVIVYYPWSFLLLNLQELGDKVIVDMGDIMSDRHDRIESKNWISLSFKDEKFIVNSKAKCLAISNGDFNEFKDLYGVELQIYPFLPIRYCTKKTNTIDSKIKVGYFSSFTFSNKAVLDFITSKEFLLELNSANINMVIAGSICNAIEPSLSDFLKDNNVTILGFVEETSKFYNNIDIVLNLAGPSTGFKIKTLEALLAGCSVVVTKFGVDAVLLKDFGSRVYKVDYPLCEKDVIKSIVKASQEFNSLCSMSPEQSLNYIKKIRTAEIKAFE
jgi:hypothetical protein